MESALHLSDKPGLDAYTPIFVGTSITGAAAGRRVELALHKATNFSMLLVGMSGSGKTHTIKELVREFVNRGIITIAIDTQGDLCKGETRIPDSIRYDIKFGYSGAVQTINPLQIQNYNDVGGLNETVIDVVETIRTVKPELGGLQENELREIILATYLAKGITLNDKASWLLPGPAWEELCLAADEKYQVAISRLTPNFFRDLDKLAGLYRARDRAEESEAESYWAKVELAKKQLTEVVDRAVDARNQHDAEYFKVNKAQRLEGIVYVLNQMRDANLFGNDEFSLKRGRCNVFDISTLVPRHQLMMIKLLLDRVFFRAVRLCGDRMNEPVPSIMLILDEAKLAVATAQTSMSMLNRIGTEGRKYGLGLVAGVQHLGMLNEDLRTNFSTTFVFQIDSSKHDEASRRLGIPREFIADIKPKSDALFKFNQQAVVPVTLFR